MKWRYSLRWKLPSPCPGEHELVSEVVEAGQPAPASVMSRWVAGAGYAVCLDFISDRQVCRWSEERKAAVRRRNLEKRINRHARKRLTRTVLIFTESSDQLSRATDRVPGLPASPGYVQ